MGRLLVVGFGHRPGGFTRVVHSLVDEWRRGWEVLHLAINLDAAPQSGVYPWTMVAPPRSDDAFGTGTLEALLRSFKPDVVFFLNDFWYLAPYRSLLQRPRGFRAIAYVPLDGAILRPEFLLGLGAFDHIAVYTSWARSDMARHFGRLKERFPSFVAPPISVVPHGVDTSVFGPTEDAGPRQDVAEKRALARQMSGVGRRSDFVVYNGNQNHSRKRLDISIEGFARFAADKNDVLLHMHGATRPQHQSSGGFDLIDLVERHNLKDVVRFSDTTGRPANCSSEMLNSYYNGSDVGLNTSWGEGWGLVSFEHAAAAVPQVVPNHTACAELWSGAAILLDTSSDVPDGSILERRNVAPDDVAYALERLYQDEALRARLSLEALRIARDPAYQWSRVAGTFHSLFRDVREGLQTRE